MADSVTRPASPLQFRDFRLLWLARFCSVLATTGMVVIIGYQLYDVARSDYGMSIGEAALQLGLLGLVQFLPFLVLSPVSGLVADRYDRRYVAAIAVCLDLVIAATLAVTTYSGTVTLPLLFGLAALHGAARVFVNPAVAAIVPNIVPPDVMPRAIASSSIAWQVGSVAGPAAAGLLYAFGKHLPYAAGSILLIASAISVLAIGKLPLHAANRDVHPVRQILDGFRYVWHERFLLGCVTLDLFAVLMGGAT
ncbi:MAG: MFS transporter, partial [Novosphingobium sp.]